MTLQATQLGAGRQIAFTGQQEQKKVSPVATGVVGVAGGAALGGTVLAPRIIPKAEKLTVSNIKKLMKDAPEALKKTLNTALEGINNSRGAAEKFTGELRTTADNLVKDTGKLTKEAQEKVTKVFIDGRKEVFNNIKKELPKSRISGAAKSGAIGAAVLGVATMLYNKMTGNKAQ